MTPNLFCWIPDFLKFQLVLNSLTFPFCRSSYKEVKIRPFLGCILTQLGKLCSLTLDADLRGQMTSKWLETCFIEKLTSWTKRARHKIRPKSPINYVTKVRMLLLLLYKSRKDSPWPSWCFFMAWRTSRTYLDLGRSLVCSSSWPFVSASYAHSL